MLAGSRQHRQRYFLKSHFSAPRKKATNVHMPSPPGARALRPVPPGPLLPVGAAADLLWDDCVFWVSMSMSRSSILCRIRALARAQIFGTSTYQREWLREKLREAASCSPARDRQRNPFTQPIPRHATHPGRDEGRGSRFSSIAHGAATHASPIAGFRDEGRARSRPPRRGPRGLRPCRS